jgi:hypothetical protein
VQTRDRVRRVRLVLLFFARHTLFPTRRRPRSIRALSSTPCTASHRPLSFMAHKATIVRVGAARSSALRPPRPLGAQATSTTEGSRLCAKTMAVSLPNLCDVFYLDVDGLRASRPRWLQP